MREVGSEESERGVGWGGRRRKTREGEGGIGRESAQEHPAHPCSAPVSSPTCFTSQY